MISKKGYYSNSNIMFEIIYQLQKRETCFIPFDPITKKAQPPVRWLMANYIEMLKRHFNQFGFYDKKMNLYNSLSTYNNMPMFSYMWNIKAQEQKIWLEKFQEYLVKYDFFIETDSHDDFNLAQTETKDIIDLFNQFNIRYYCKFSLAGDTPILIRNEQGIKLIEIEQAINYVNNSEVLTLSKDNKVCWRKILNFISHDDKLINIYHRQGGNIPIQCTKDHSAFILDENWNIIEKKGTDLKVGDFLITLNNTDIVKDEIKEIDFEYKFKKVIRKEKIEITNELMWCLGAYLGDGSISSHEVQLGKSNFELVERFGNYFKAHYYISKRGKYKTLKYAKIHSKKWRDFFEYSCSHLAGNKHIPPYIWQLSKDKIYSFIQGYIDTDGTKTNFHTLTIKTKSKTIMKELCWLLKLIGISCRINSEITKDHPNPYGKNIIGGLRYIISINKEEMKELHPFYFKESNKFSPESIDNCLPTDIFKKLFNLISPTIMGGVKGKRPDGMIRNKDTLSREFLRTYLNWIKETNRNKTIEVDDIVKRIELILNSDVRITKIKEIKHNLTYSKVYDISVEDTERFYTGNYPLLFSNSGSKGFHIIVSHDDFAHLDLPIYSKDYSGNIKNWIEFLKTFPNDKEKLKLYCDYPLLFKSIVLRIKGLLASDTIDPSISDIKRVCKVAYSVDDKSGLVAYPLSDTQFLNFRKEHYTPENVLKMNNFKRRLLWRNDNLTIQQRQSNIDKLLEHIGILKERLK